MARQYLGWSVSKERGTWRARVRIDGTYRNRQGFTRRADAVAWAKAARAAIDHGKHLDATRDKLRMDELVKDYVATLRRQGRSVGHIRHVAPFLERLAKDVPSLSSPTVRHRLRMWMEERAPSRAARTWNRELNQLRAFLRYLEDCELINWSRLPGIQARPVPKTIKPQMTIAELRRLLASVEPYGTGRAREGADVGRWVALMVYTGMRAREAATVHWPDFEWDAGVLMIRNRPGRALKTGERIVPIQAELADMLKPHQRDRGAVCTLNLDNLNRAWDGYLRRRGLDRGEGQKLTPHSLRHSYVGMMTATGEPAAVVRLYVGHSSDSMTHYYSEAAALYRRQTESWERGKLMLKGEATSLEP